MTPNDYTGLILIERNSIDRCGYPACWNRASAGRPLDRRSSPVRISTAPAPAHRRRRLRPSAFVGHGHGHDHDHDPDDEDEDPEPRFCSQTCRDRSDEYVSLLLRTASPSPADDPHRSSTGLTTTRVTSDRPTGRDRRTEDRHRAPSAPARPDPSIGPDLDGPVISSPPRPFDFSRPILDQFQPFDPTRRPMINFPGAGAGAGAHHPPNRSRLVDRNLNRAFSSIKIFEHPPPPRSASTPLVSISPPKKLPSSGSRSFLDPSSTSSASIDPSASGSTLTTRVDLPRSAQDTLDPLDRLSSPCFARSLTSQTIRLNSGSDPLRARSSHPHPSIGPDAPLDPVSPSDPIGWGDPQAEVIYNVGSMEDRLAIDRAMILRDQLLQPPTDPSHLVSPPSTPKPIKGSNP